MISELPLNELMLFLKYARKKQYYYSCCDGWQAAEQYGKFTTEAERLESEIERRAGLAGLDLKTV